MDPQAASSLSDFSETDRKELQQFIENEHQKAKFQTSNSPLPYPYILLSLLSLDDLNPQLKLSDSCNCFVDVHNLTDMCWTKCMTAKITSTAIEKSENTCLENCVNRFIDSQKTIVKQLDYMGGRA